MVILSFPHIKSGGYTGFNQGVQGQRTDHRCLWIDMPTSALIGSKTPPITRFQGRRFKSGHPKIAKHFNKKYEEFMIKNNLHQAIYRLEADVCFPITDEQRDRVEKIAKLRAEGIQYADKKCRWLFRAEIPYTPDLRKLIAKVRAWKLVVRKK